VDYLAGRMKACVDTGLNVIDVADVARGHLLAAERGRVGERYILGHRNLTLEELFALLEEVSGVRAPRLMLPHWVPLAAAAMEELVARAAGRPARLSLESVQMSRQRMFFSAAKAVRELGLPQSPVEPALERAVRWFRDHGRA
jgi:dihydroflavonol-4-reductase